MPNGNVRAVPAVVITIGANKARKNILKICKIRKAVFLRRLKLWKTQVGRIGGDMSILLLRRFPHLLKGGIRYGAFPRRLLKKQHVLGLIPKRKKPDCLILWLQTKAVKQPLTLAAVAK